MTPARRNCPARSHTRIGYSTSFIDSSFAVGIEPFARGAESRLGDRGLGCCGGDSAVSERSRLPGTTAAAWLRWWLPKWRPRLRHGSLKDARTFLASR